MVVKLFMNYSFKEYQLQKQKINKKKLAKYFGDKFAKTKETFLYKKKNQILGLASLNRFDALSKICQKNVYFLKDLVVQKNDQQIYQDLIKKVYSKYSVNFDFLIVRQPVDNNAAINALIKTGFYYVCSESIYALNNLSKRNIIKNDEYKYIRKAEKKDLSFLKKIASNNHNFKRYLFDDFFENDQIKDLYNQVIENSFSQINHEIFVYEKNNKVKGFISVIINHQLSNIMKINYASLDYITVDEKYQKEGIGYLLSNFALNYLKETHSSEVISVKTMANNYQAINLLNKMGFCKTSESLILHYQDNKK